MELGNALIIVIELWSGIIVCVLHIYMWIVCNKNKIIIYRSALSVLLSPCVAKGSAQNINIRLRAFELCLHIYKLGALTVLFFRQTRAQCFACIFVKFVVGATSLLIYR
jgi:hypothetical protein